MEFDLDRLRDERPDLWDRYTLRLDATQGVVDEYGRRRWAYSGISDPRAPVVSDWLHENGFAPKWPDGHSFAVCLTHDVDVLHYSRKHTAWDATVSLARDFLRHGPPIRRERFSRRRLNPLWCFEDIMELERRYDATSSFYFLALEPGEDDYNFSVTELRDEFSEIAASGCEIGLHGGHSAWHAPEVLAREKERLEDATGQPVVGYRSHYLRIRTPDTWRLLQEAGFTYDTTFGWHDAIGFRNGLCHPFQPYDLAAGEQMGILELPLAIMDRTLDRYAALDDAAAWEAIRPMIDRVATLGGVLTVLWHNTEFTGSRRDLYERILSHSRDAGAWLTNGRDVADWWLKK